MPATVPRTETRWRSALEEHQVALAGYLNAAAALPADAWTTPWQPGKWTPAEITEHLALVYRMFIGEATTGTAMKLKLTPFRRRMLKLLLLPHMLFHRTFPKGARAPRAVRPHTPGGTREEALAQLRTLAEQFERAAETARGAGRPGLTHPYFGLIDWNRGMRFAALHIEHHRGQIARKRSA
ncbi:DinB family protein [Longimicrobium sp.]|jgi:hypothetical protein|uniref:DinB family protein n=1 Tax=Longimicrobium sp. TaxID=2029185 RepID=UPI002ED91DA6